MLANLFDMQSETDVERMPKHVFGPNYVNRIKAAGRLTELSDRVLKDIGPRTLAAIRFADWEAAELSENRETVIFRSPLYPLTFTLVNGDWRLQLR